MAAKPGDNKAARRSMVVASSAFSHWASKAVCSAIENSSVASIVSGVEGRSFQRRRSASSLKKAVRGAKPKSASKAVKSTVCSSSVHQACSLLRSTGSASNASSSMTKRLMAPSTAFWLPRIQLATSMIQRLRSASGASGFKLDSSSASRSGFFLRPNISAVPAPQACRSSAVGAGRHPAQSAE